MTITIDALGQPCPIPVVRARQAIAGIQAEGGSVQVLVDNRVACENLQKMAQGSGYGFALDELETDRFQATLTVEAGAAGLQAPLPAVESGEGLVVAISGSSMGRGSEELGHILIKGFLYALSQLDAPPRAVLFFNGGVHLTLQEANTAEDLQELARRGTRIGVCGTCVDYYQVKDRIAVGEIVNMYDIVSEMNGASRVINL